MTERCIPPPATTPACYETAVLKHAAPSDIPNDVMFRLSWQTHPPSGLFAVLLHGPCYLCYLFNYLFLCTESSGQERLLVQWSLPRTRQATAIPVLRRCALVFWTQSIENTTFILHFYPPLSSSNLQTSLQKPEATKTSKKCVRKL